MIPKQGESVDKIDAVGTGITDPFKGADWTCLYGIVSKPSRSIVEVLLSNRKQQIKVSTECSSGSGGNRLSYNKSSMLGALTCKTSSMW